MECERHELEIEKRARGALSADEAAALDLHLAGCASCRAFEATVHEMESVMQANTMHEMSKVDWNRIERGFHGMVTAYRKANTRMAIAALPLVAVITWVAAPGERFVTALASSVIVAGILAIGLVVRRRIDAKVTALSGKPADLVISYREELDTTIRRLRHGRVYLPVFGALWLTVGVRELVSGASPSAILWLAMSALLFVQAVLAHRQLPRRLRERAEIG